MTSKADIQALKGTLPRLGHQLPWHENGFTVGWIPLIDLTFNRSNGQKVEVQSDGSLWLDQFENSGNAKALSNEVNLLLNKAGQAPAIEP